MEPSRGAELKLLAEFTGSRAYSNPYLDSHRPCGFATVRLLARGRWKRIYRPEDYRTPYEVVSLPGWQQYLKEGITTEHLKRQACG